MGEHYLNFRCLTDMIDQFIRKRCVLTDWFVNTETMDLQEKERMDVYIM